MHAIGLITTTEWHGYISDAIFCGGLEGGIFSIWDNVPYL